MIDLIIFKYILNLIYFTINSKIFVKIIATKTCEINAMKFIAMKIHNYLDQ